MDGPDDGKKLVTERVRNVMGSCAGAGSGEFHLYRHARRTEMLRVEAMDKAAEEAELDAEFAERVERKRKECQAKTLKNAAKRAKKKRKFKNDGSFLDKAKELLETS